MNNLYSISEAFSKYHELSSQWLQLGHSPYQTNIQSACELKISRNEFINYLENNSPKYFYIFKTCNSDFKESLNLSIITHEYNPNMQLYKIIAYETDFNRKYEVSEKLLNDGSVYRNIHIFNNLIPKSLLIKNYQQEDTIYLPKPYSMLPYNFRDSNCKIIFDVYTTYQILTNRESCVNIIKDYAKQITLQQFNEMIDKLHNTNYASYTLYLQLNARVLDIDTYNKTGDQIEFEIQNN
jgi:hypothetical protein